MRVLICLALGATAAGQLQQNVLQQVQELQAEIEEQRQLIEQLKENRRLQEAETESIADKITKLQDWLYIFLICVDVLLCVKDVLHTNGAVMAVVKKMWKFTGPVYTAL